MGKYVEELVMNKLQEIKSRSNEYEVGRVVSVREYFWKSAVWKMPHFTRESRYPANPKDM